MTTDMTTDIAVLPPTTPSAPADPVPVRGRLGQLGTDTAYVLLGFPLAIAAFCVVVTGLAAGTGLLVIRVGVAVLTATLLAARGLAVVERAQLPAVLGHPLPNPAYRRAQPGAGLVARLTTPLRVLATLAYLRG